MNTNIKRRAYQRLGLLMGTIGLLVIGRMLGVIGDEQATASGLVGGIVMVLLGGWAIVRGQRIGTSRE